MFPRTYPQNYSQYFISNLKKQKAKQETCQCPVVLTINIFFLNLMSISVYTLFSAKHPVNKMNKP